MTNNSSHFSTVPSQILISSVVFKFFAMIIGVLGNITVIIYAIFTSKEKTAASYLVGNLALADLLVCLTFYPIWMIEFIQTILSIESDQDLFCKLSRSTFWALMFASMATLLAITVDRCFYIVKPLKYPSIVTKQRVVVAISGIWLTAFFYLIVLLVHYRKFENGLRGLCYADNTLVLLQDLIFVYFPLTLIVILNFWILIVAAKQRKRILAETATNRDDVNGFFHALKAVKTFSIVVAVLTFCVLTPSLVGLAVYINSSCNSCKQLWFVVFYYEFFGINSIVNAYIYGMRHIKYRKAPRQIIFRIFRSNRVGTHDK